MAYSPTGDYRWLDAFVDDPAHSFERLVTGAPRGDWHARGQSRVSPLRWLADWRGLDLSRVDGVITAFPSQAVAVALRNRLRRRPVRHVAWYFNLGHRPHGPRRVAAALALRQVDRIVVPSSAEVGIVRELFGLDAGQVEFVHLQGPDRPVLAQEDIAHPFVVAVGSANRDLATLLDALRISGLPAKIVAAPRLLADLRPPPGVELLSGLTPADCWRLTQQARIAVVPIRDPRIASGQVTVIDALTMGTPLVTTRSIGTVDYVADGTTGVLVEPGDAAGLARVLAELWDDPPRRAALAAGGRAFAAATLSDPVIGRRLGEILTAVAREPR